MVTELWTPVDKPIDAETVTVALVEDVEGTTVSEDINSVFHALLETWERIDEFVNEGSVIPELEGPENWDPVKVVTGAPVLRVT